MLLPLKLPLLWAGEWAPGANLAFTTGCKEVSRYQLLMQESVMVREGLCVLIPCSFSTKSNPVYGYWFWKGANTGNDPPVATNNPDQLEKRATQDWFLLLGNFRNKNCSLSIRDTQRGDSSSYLFHTERGKVQWNYCRNPIFVNVTGKSPLQVSYRGR
jgi:hypothetical protein